MENEKQILKKVRENGMALEFVKDQTEEICREAVHQNPNALQYVKNKTLEIRLAADSHYLAARQK